jgi:hypothetical protein
LRTRARALSLLPAPSCSSPKLFSPPPPPPHLLPDAHTRRLRGPAWWRQKLKKKTAYSGSTG